MRVLRLLAVVVLTGGLSAAAQGPTPDTDAAVRAVLNKQVVDWNRGDLDAFEAGYKNSPDIIFMGASVQRGYDGMVAAYRKGYGTAEKRGTLSYTDLEVHAVDAKVATVVGKFHLERTAAGGGNADGAYSLVFEKTAAGWKIILDHTTATTAPVASH